MIDDIKIQEMLEKCDPSDLVGTSETLGGSRLSSRQKIAYSATERDKILKNTTFFRVNCLTFEKNFPRQEAFENVINALKNSECRIIYYLRGCSGKVDFFVGISPPDGCSRYNRRDYADMLERVFKGNFTGSEISEADSSVTQFLTEDLTFKTVLGVPSRNTDKEDLAFQSVDRLVNVMNAGRYGAGSGQDFHVLVIWETVDLHQIQEFGFQVENLYNRLSVYAHASAQQSSQNSSQNGTSVQKGISESRTEGKTSGTSSGTSTGSSTSNSEGISDSVSTSSGSTTGSSKNTTSGKSTSKTTGSSTSETKGNSDSLTEGTSSGSSETNGTNEGKSEGKSESTSSGRNSTSYSTNGGKSWSKSTNQGSNSSKTIGSSTSETTGTSTSDTQGSSTSTSEGNSTSSSSTKGETKGKSHSVTTGKSTTESTGTNESVSASTTSSTTESSGKSESTSSGTSIAVTSEIKNKRALDILKYIDEELMPRIRRGIAKGMYRTAVYVGAGTSLNCDLLCNTLLSLTQGEKSFNNSVYGVELADSKLPSLFEIARCRVEESPSVVYSHLLNSRPVKDNFADVGTWLTAQEIGMLAGFPQKEVPGLELRERVSFGLNVGDCKDQLLLGKMMQEGNCLEQNEVCLSRKELTRHVFIAGTTGSGKTTTCHRILASSASAEHSLPFLVVEPAKTEYRALVKSGTPGFDEIIVFTVGNGIGVPFRFNPLEFLEEETLSGHIDQLKAAFMASFDMEAAIPNLMEQGLYEVYRRMGWDIESGKNRYLQNRHDAWCCGGSFFPTLSDYIDVVVELVKHKGFDDRLRDEYIGSIRARLDSLINGTKGAIFDTQLSVDFNDLLDRKVIIELEDVKSSEDKSFMMALIISRLAETIKARHRRDPGFIHVTLIEEAHRLLTRVMPGDSQNRKMGVELFSDLLAEIRKYGESLIIVDQIPSKLASEVLKNTNTKIIHKLFSRDDKDAVGDTMALDERQRKYLSYLQSGEAVVFTQGWKQPVNVKVDMIGNGSGDDVEDEEVFRNGREYWFSQVKYLCPFIPDLQQYNAELQWEQLIELSGTIKRFIRECLSNSQNSSDKELWQDNLKAIQGLCGDENLFKSISKKLLLNYYVRRQLFNDSRRRLNYQDYVEKIEDKIEKNWPGIIKRLETGGDVSVVINFVPD